MSQDCSKCIKVSQLENKMDKMETTLSEINKKVVILDKKDAVDDERKLYYNKTVEKIQASITNIEARMDKSEKKPLDTIEKVKLTLIGGGAMYVLNQIISNLVK